MSTGTVILEGELKEGIDPSGTVLVANAALALAQRGWHQSTIGPSDALTVTCLPVPGGESDLTLAGLLNAGGIDGASTKQVALLAADSTGTVAGWSAPWRLYRVPPLRVATHVAFTVLTPKHPRYW